MQSFDMFEQAEQNKDRLEVLKQEYKLASRWVRKRKKTANHIRLIKYMNTKGGK